MKASEITIGHDYAYGTKGRWKTYRQARVLELGKHRVLESSAAEVPAARIQFLDLSKGDLNADDEVTQWVVLRSILMPWSEHVEAQARHNRAWEGQAQRNSENAERARNTIKELGELGFDTGTEPFELVGEQAISSGWVRVKIEFLEDVLDALT